MHRINFSTVTKCLVPEFGLFMSTIPSVEMRDVGENITYRCDRGYEIAGTTKTELISQCLENIAWSRDPPVCEGKPIVPSVQINALCVLFKIVLEKIYIAQFKLVCTQRNYCDNVLFQEKSL